jgi:glycosyl transferase family 2
MTRPPPVSVVMPVFNAEAFVAAAVESVLGQTFEDFELLVLDDGSTDASLDVVRSLADPRLRIVSRPHEGVVRTMNAALGLARAELIARADADDVCMPERLTRQLDVLATQPGLALVGGAMRCGDRLLEYPPDATRMRWLALYRNPVGNPTILFRRPAAVAVGGYPEDFQLLDDYPFVSRLLARYDAANLTEPLVIHRANPTGISGRHGRAQAAEGDRVRRANIAALVPEPGDAADLFGLLLGRGAPAAGSRAVRRLLDHLIDGFRRRWGLDGQTWRAMAPWVARELLDGALLHGAAAPAVLLRMATYACRLDARLALRARTVRGLVRHLLIGRARW